MLHLLHVVPTYLPAYRYGGPIASVHGLCKALVHQGEEVTVYTTNVDGERDSQVPINQVTILDRVKVGYFQCPFFRRLYWAPGLKRTLELSIASFDLLHLHSVFVWPTSMAAHIARRHKIPYVLSPRGMLVKALIRKKNFLIKSAWMTLIERRTVEGASAIHVTSELEAEELKKFGYKLPPVYCIPNGIDDGGERINEPESSSNKIFPDMAEPYLLFLGRVSWKKGIDLLIRAMVFIPHINLVIAGYEEENYQHKLLRIISELKLSQRIRFAGPVYGNQKSALLKNAQALVLPSLQENFGNVVLEAMQAGCPVVVSPNVGLAPMIQETGAGIVVDREPEILGKAVQELLSNQTLLDQMKQRGPVVVRKRFDWNMIAKQMEAVYLKILNKGQK